MIDPNYLRFAKNNGFRSLHLFENKIKIKKLLHQAIFEKSIKEINHSLPYANDLNLKFFLSESEEVNACCAQIKNEKAIFINDGLISQIIQYSVFLHNMENISNLIDDHAHILDKNKLACQLYFNYLVTPNDTDIFDFHESLIEQFFNPEREEKFSSLFRTIELVVKFCIVHEISHVFRSHMEFSYTNMGEHIVKEIYGKGIYPEYSLAHAMEYDADMHSIMISQHIFSEYHWKTKESPHRNNDWDNLVHVSGVLALQNTLEAAIALFIILDTRSIQKQESIRHPSSGYRLYFIELLINDMANSLINEFKEWGYSEKDTDLPITDFRILERAWSKHIKLFEKIGAKSSATINVSEAGETYCTPFDGAITFEQSFECYSNLRSSFDDAALAKSTREYIEERMSEIRFQEIT